MNIFLDVLLGLAVIVTIVSGPSIIKGFLDLVDEFYATHRTFARILWYTMVVASIGYVVVYYFTK